MDPVKLGGVEMDPVKMDPVKLGGVKMDPVKMDGGKNLH